MADSVIPLKCTCNNYPWGKKGTESLAARLCKEGNPDFRLDNNTHYSEMWFGTYPELPSYSLETGEDLQQILNEHKEQLIGKRVYQKFGADLPFLPKILSIAKALPLQIHPNKQLSEKLHEENPEQFTDPNHKPEIAVALSKFEAFVGFKPHAEIHELMKLNALQQFVPTKAEGINVADDEILRQICTNLLKADEDVVESTFNKLLAMSKEELGKQAYILDLAKRLQEQYGKQDNGNLVALLCMNFMTLDPGSAIYIPADGIHAYLSGDIVECMARSNNVLNTGFCPRADRDSVDLFAKSLTFKQHDPDEPILQRKRSSKSQNGKTVELTPPMSEFNMLITELGSGEMDTITAVEGPSTVIVTSGSGKMSVGGQVFELHEGKIFFVGQGVEIEMGADDGLVVYRAYADVFRVPAPPRRRKRKSTEDPVLARLKYYEDLLREKGIDPTSPAVTGDKTETPPTPSDGEPSSPAPSLPKVPSWVPGSAQGKLIVDQGRTRFVENKLWTAVTEQLYHSKDAMPESETDDELELPADRNTDFVLGMTPSSTQTASLHPSADHILRLWQIFLTNVNPLIKIVHQPTLQRAIEEAIPDIDHIPRGLEALMFAIYGAALLSMHDGECQAIFGEARSVLQSRYSLGVRRSLTRAHFMGTSDMVVLQALVIYLLTMRQELDARTLWNLSGVATRIAQGMGAHRDGTILGLPPFETEMRRRLWWQLNLLEFKATEMNGIGGFNAIGWWNTKTPLNVNDSDMWPGMKDPPVERVRPTEMIIPLLHYEMGGFWRKKLREAGTPEHELSHVMQQWVMTMSTPAKDVFVDEFQASMEDKILRYCDPSVPLEMMALIIGRMVCKAMRFISHHPRRYSSEKDIPENERRFLWITAMGIIEADNLAHSHGSLQKFQWHLHSGFQWHSFIHVLGELIVRPLGEGKDDAWTQLEDVFKNHPKFITDRRKPLHLAIANLCLKAWRAREKAQAEDLPRSLRLQTPRFILQLHEQREAEEAKAAAAAASQSAQLNLISKAKCMTLTTQSQQPGTTNTQDMAPSPGSNQQFPQPGTHYNPMYSPDDFSVMDDMAMDWQRWDTLLNDLEMPTQQPALNPAQLPFLAQYGQQGNSWSLPQHPQGFAAH